MYNKDVKMPGIGMFLASIPLYAYYCVRCLELGDKFYICVRCRKSRKPEILYAMQNLRFIFECIHAVCKSFG
jgi:hypothetical protein